MASRQLSLHGGQKQFSTFLASRYAVGTHCKNGVMAYQPT
jgi:hypothetical protein